MDAQRTPEALSTQAENELICEKLLGWKRYVPDAYEGQDRRWKRTITLPGITGDVKEHTPSFTTWAEAGLILEALQKLSYDKRSAADVLVLLGDRLIGALLTPADIRAAALDYLKQTMGWHTYLKAVKS